MPPDLVDQLEDVIRQHALAAMPHDQSGELAAMPLSDLLIVYGTWRSRFIPQRPRRANLSAELIANPKSAQHEHAVDAITRKIEAGEDLTPHLSKAVKVAYIPKHNRGKPKRRMDRDLLLADWGIHHLHLSTTIEADGFVKRGNDLLFAAFTPDEAYLIDIYAHKQWALLDTLRIVVHNWPQAGLLQQLQFITGLTQQYSDDDRLQLRNAGVAGLVEIDGKVYMPPGQTTAGTPLAATMRSNNLTWALKRLRDLGNEGVATLLNETAAGGSNDKAWTPTIHDEWCGFVSDGLFVPIAAVS